MPNVQAADHSIVKGVPHLIPDDLSQLPLCHARLRQLRAAGLPFDIRVPQRQLALEIELVHNCPDKTIALYR